MDRTGNLHGLYGQHNANVGERGCSRLGLYQWTLKSEFRISCNEWPSCDFMDMAAYPSGDGAAHACATGNAISYLKSTQSPPRPPHQWRQLYLLGT